MNKMESQASNTISENICLNRLGACLLQYFPLPQVQEILADYQEYFSLGKERGASTEGLLQELKKPSDIRQELLKEMPNGRRFFLLWTGGWTALFLLALHLCFYSLPFHTTPIKVLILFMGSITLSLFALLHGRARSCLEQQLGFFPLKKSFFILQLFLPLVTILTEYIMQQLLVRNPESIPATVGIWPIGPVINSILCFLVFLLGLLLIWILLQIRAHSIRYYPGAVHTLGTIFFLLDIRSILHSMDLDISNMEAMRQELLMPLYWYGAGLLLAILFALLLKPGKKHGLQPFSLKM